MSDGYVRQRRNLISISILLLLTILGGAITNPLYPIKLERPYVAEIFMWIGFVYFWYRTGIYSPNNIFQNFRNEIILSYIIKYEPVNYSRFNLSSFTGLINVINKSPDISDKTIFQFTGTTQGIGDAKIGNIAVPINEEVILGKMSYLKNIFGGKVVTDYFLPHVIAIVTLLLGLYKYRSFF